MKKIIIGAAAIVIVALAGIAISFGISGSKTTTNDYVNKVENVIDEKDTQKDEVKENNSESKNEAPKETQKEEKLYTPTFMYFISNSDDKFEETNALIEDLKKEYDKKIKFEIVNIDEKPESKENFPVEGQTPALIMLNTANDISAMNFKCNDASVLKAAIETALSN